MITNNISKELDLIMLREIAGTFFSEYFKYISNINLEVFFNLTGFNIKYNSFPFLIENSNDWIFE